MCQGSEGIGINQCGCRLKIEDKVLSKKELLIRLKKYKKNLESALDAVNSNLESSATAEKGGD